MMGFLGRALASARGAEQRLKPLTGSVYAGDHRRHELQPASWAEETINVPAAPSVIAPARQHSPPAAAEFTRPMAPEAPLLQPADTPPTSSVTQGSGDEPRLLPATRPPIVSPAAHRERESAARPAFERDASQPPSPAPLLRGNPSLLPDWRPTEGPRAETAVPPSPVRAENSPDEPRRAPSPPPQPQPLLRPSTAARPPAVQPHLAMPKSRPPQEPEIQVHIGRIEVIAATPQPSRVPPPRPNRATSLADYLAGENGRKR